MCPLFLSPAFDTPPRFLFFLILKNHILNENQFSSKIIKHEKHYVKNSEDCKLIIVNTDTKLHKNISATFLLSFAVNQSPTIIDLHVDLWWLVWCVLIFLNLIISISFLFFAYPHMLLRDIIRSPFLTLISMFSIT